MLFSKKAPHMPACMAVHLVVLVLLGLAALAALVGVYLTHTEMQGDTFSFVFGSSQASLAILAFAYSTKALLGQMKCCMTKCDVCKP